MYDENELIPISALQHVLFCERQCALIHVERVWADNENTVRGEFFHDRAHSHKREVRGTAVVVFGLDIRSLELGMVGRTDGVELEYSDRTLSRVLSAVPVEYKVGRPKQGQEDAVQLCAQALCLEEMLGISIPRAALFYGKTRHRLWVELGSGLRDTTKGAVTRVRELIDSATTPPPVYRHGICESCSFFGICKPRVFSRKAKASDYIMRQVADALAKEGG